MFSALTDWIMETVRFYGPWGVIIGVIIESVIVPIPSPLIIMGAGMLLIDPGIPLLSLILELLRLVVLPGALASTAGSFFGYGIGYWGGKPAVIRLEKFLGFGWDEVEQFQQRFQNRRLGVVIFTLRALPIVPLSLISAAVGALRWPVWPFAVWTFLGSIPRCLILGYLGWLMRDAYHSLAHDFNLVETIVSVAIVGAAAILVLWLRANYKKKTSASV